MLIFFAKVLRLIPLLVLCSCRPDSDSPSVILYSSVDEAYSRPVCRQFEAESGIRVKLVTDTEAAKGSSLVTRLLMERGSPQADIFWCGDLMRATQLADKGLAAQLDGSSIDPAQIELRKVQTDLGVQCSPARVRVIIYHRPTLSSSDQLPQRVEDLANPSFASRACIANPLFGTTSMHAAAMLQIWGEERTKQFFEEFAKNGGRMLASNGEVKRRVGSGEFAYGLTDSDDVNVALIDNLPIGFVLPDQSVGGAVLIPSAVMLVNNAPHIESAKTLAEFLGSPRVVQWMAESSGAHFPLENLDHVPGRLGVKLSSTRIASLDYIRLGRDFERWRVSFLEGWVRDRQS